MILTGQSRKRKLAGWLEYADANCHHSHTHRRAHEGAPFLSTIEEVTSVELSAAHQDGVVAATSIEEEEELEEDFKTARSRGMVTDRQLQPAEQQSSAVDSPVNADGSIDNVGQVSTNRVTAERVLTDQISFDRNSADGVSADNLSTEKASTHQTESDLGSAGPKSAADDKLTPSVEEIDFANVDSDDDDGLGISRGELSQELVGQLEFGQLLDSSREEDEHRLEFVAADLSVRTASESETTTTLDRIESLKTERSSSKESAVVESADVGCAAAKELEDKDRNVQDKKINEDGDSLFPPAKKLLTQVCFVPNSL